MEVKGPEGELAHVALDESPESSIMQEKVGTASDRKDVMRMGKIQEF